LLVSRKTQSVVHMLQRCCGPVLHALVPGRKSAVALLTAAIVSVFSLMLITPLYAAYISEGYLSGSSYPLGMLASINQTEPISIEPAHLNNNSYLTGVVVSEGDSLLNINRNGATTQIAVSGDVEVFVSDVNGPIQAGDFIGASWLAGVAMLADTSSEQKLLGVALQSFSSDSPDKLELTDIETPSGRVTARVGKITIRLLDRDIGSSGSDSGIEILAQRIAGKNVAYARVLMASGLFALSAIISGVFLANAIRGSFISLGRNPLASSSIYSSLIQISGVSISLVIIGAFLAYLLLII